MFKGLRAYFPFAVLYLYTLLPIWLDFHTRIGLELSHSSWALLSAGAVSFIALLFPMHSRLYASAVFLLVYIPSGLRVLHYYIFGKLLDKGAAFAVFDTDPAEAAGFVTGYANRASVAVLTILLAAFFYAFKRVRSIDGTPHMEGLRQFFFVLLAVAGARGMFTSPRYRFAAFELYEHYYQYYNVLNIADRKARKFGPFKDIRMVLEGPQVIVFAIGESDAREHHSLYGYSRDTDGALAGVKGRLYAFANVATPHPMTITALQKVLTLATFDDMGPLKAKGSVINLFNDAGFKTFWLDNNMARTSKGRFVAAIAEDAAVAKFEQDIGAYPGFGDAKLLPALASALGDPAPRKAIFLHLRGSHWSYADRYPPDAAAFRGASDSRLEKIDHYDNSVAYAMDIVAKMVGMLGARGGVSSFLYFPDHGEDAISRDSCFCHSSTVKKDNMFEIPFILWLSDGYASARPGFVGALSKYLGRKFNTQDFPHAAADLAGVSADGIDWNKSPFSADYDEPVFHIIKTLF
ncbi:MAG: sulfatase-like hydrolase/transferase [Rickettsiales bacterium]|jgi:heptose-I-phosphate ethanolaminephosphotransferase|nr:sulfatase-like hydrolase/transferase [Rickettsiales bacterium]